MVLHKSNAASKIYHYENHRVNRCGDFPINRRLHRFKSSHRERRGSPPAHAITSIDRQELFS
ncbi:Uncharacterized protein PPKH_1301 [Pseudomonas putida]|nr:Uncharacterized protein PPKH_1301 [Pseudomonas putida]